MTTLPIPDAYVPNISATYRDELNMKQVSPVKLWESLLDFPILVHFFSERKLFFVKRD